jgi:hypothetical protein
MTKRLKLILAATAIAALASPVMAQQSERHQHASSPSIAHSHRSARPHEVVQTKSVEKHQSYKNECGYDMYVQCYN